MTPLSFKHQEELKPFFEAHPPQLSEMTFTNLFIWSKSRKIYFQIARDTLFFYKKEEDEWIPFGEPIGPEKRFPHPSKTQERILLASADLQKWESQLNRDQADYLLKMEELVELDGHPFHRLRQQIRSCEQRYQPAYFEITEKEIPEIRDWIDTLVIRTPEEKEALFLLLEHYTRLPLIGGLLRVENQIAAMLIGEKLNPTTLVGHVEKSNHDFHGMTPMMYHSFAKNAGREFTYFNIEQDLGLKGLRTMKERLRPDQMILKYDARRHTADPTE